MSRSVCSALPLVVLAACNGGSPISLAVIAPDGGDPFLDPDAANRVRVIVEDDVTPVQTSMVGSNGSFALQVTPANTNVASRVRVEALRDNAVIGTGATPPMVWAQVEGQLAAVLMHYTDTLVPGPVTLSQGRREFELLPFSTWGFVAFANAPGATTDALPSGYSVLQHARLVFDQPVPAVFDGDTAIVQVASSWLFQRGPVAGRYTNSNVAPVQMDIMPPDERAKLVHPAVVDDLRNGGGLLLGGRDVMTGTLSTRADHVSSLIEFDVTAPPALSTAREHPDVLTVHEQLNSTQQPQYVVVGGQRANEGALLEFYAPGSPEMEGHGNVLTGDASVDARTGASTACVQTDAEGCALALVVGGRLVDGTPADSFLLDAKCVRTHVVDANATCAIVPRRGADWLHVPRWNARVALADGGMVVVAGGENASGAVYEVETVDVTNLGDATFPRPGRVLMTYDAMNPAVMSLSNGEVVIAGGTITDPNTMAASGSAEVWFYRF